MKCKDCSCCHEVSWTGKRSKYIYYQCWGTKEPFWINNIEQECSLHKFEQKSTHTFVFETDSDWEPMSPACWSDCPFNFFIRLGKSCRCINNEYPCPFVNDRYKFD